jgi:hypothetical protein
MKALMALVLLLAGSLHAAGGAVEVKSDGVTLESREAMMRTARDYNLHLGFVQADGSFLANVEVAIHDARGAPVWSGMAAGPLLFARVPPGSYVVTATAEGQTLKRTVKAAGGGAVNYLRWPAR